ncbi:MAG: tetratricopeptide repeat protein [Phycisphaeraceae bacterium]|nr:tetratricopeptide repeat protein [Phycisphaeraceae bacterium]
MPHARKRWMTREWSSAMVAAWCLLWVGLASPPARADATGAPPPGARQPESPDVVPPMAPPEVAASVRALLDAEFLSDDEKKDLRIRHGVWEAKDLDTPARKARAAAASGRLRDASLDDPAADPHDRAHGLIGRGEAERALDVLAGVKTMRAAYLSARAMWDLGRLEDARTSLERVRTTLMEVPLSDSSEVAYAVRAMVIHLRLAGEGEAAPDGGARAAGFQSLMSSLARAREQIDRLDPIVYLAEAELLEEKENYREASAALSQCMSLHPRLAEAWVLLGRMSVQTWDFERSLAIAARLDRLGLDDDGPGDLFTPRSAGGGEIAARAYLRLQDPDAAIAAIERALEVAPRGRALLALRAAAWAGNFDETRAAEHLAAFEALAPGSPVASYEMGSVLSDLRQYEDAERFLEEARRRAPRWAMAASELGLLQVQAGRDDRALATLREAAALDPFNTRVANSLTLVTEIAGYSRLTSEHFEIRFKPGIDEVLAGEMLGVMEANFARVTGSDPGGIDFVPPGRTVIELYPDHHWFSVRITGMRRIHTIAAATGPVIAMERPMAGPGHSLGPYDWPRVLRHEYTHTVTLARTRNRLPHWFTEAAAVHLEDSPRDESRSDLLTRALETGGLLDFSRINTAFVRPRTPTERGLAYAQGHWMYEYMIDRFGPRAPLNLMDRYARGEREAAAFEAEFGLSRERFFEQFVAWARVQCRAWGTLPPEGMPSVVSLLEVGDNGNAGPGAQEPSPELVQTLLDRYPDHPDLVRLAVGYELAERQGQADESMIPMLERLSRVRPIDHMPHKQLARIHLASATPWKAVAHLEFLDDREQYSTTYALELARLHAVAGDLEAAYRRVERASRIAPFDPSVRELAASIALMRKDYATARRHITAMIAIEPEQSIHSRRLRALDQLEARD